MKYKGIEILPAACLHKGYFLRLGKGGTISPVLTSTTNPERLEQYMFMQGTDTLWLSDDLWIIMRPYLQKRDKSNKARELKEDIIECLDNGHYDVVDRLKQVRTLLETNKEFLYGE